MQVTRERRHERIEDSVVGEIARMIKALAPDKSRLLQIQPCRARARQTLLFRDQLAAPGRPVIYDDEDKRDPAVAAPRRISARSMSRRRHSPLPMATST